jgi:hypothetical protein
VNTQANAPPFDVPMEVQVVDGEVVLTGPDGLNGSFTARAAAESAVRLMEAAGRASEDGK